MSNTISPAVQYLNPTYQFSNPSGSMGAGSGNDSQIMSEIEQLLNELVQPGGSSSGQCPGLNTQGNGLGSEFPGGGQYPGFPEQGQYPGFPDQGEYGGSDLQSVKLTTASGGEVDAEEDPEGDLYAQDGTSIGSIGSDGSVNLLPGASSEISTLETDGQSPFSAVTDGKFVEGSKDSNGDTTFSSNQIAISAGNLTAPTATSTPMQPLTSPLDLQV